MERLQLETQVNSDGMVGLFGYDLRGWTGGKAAAPRQTTPPHFAQLQLQTPDPTPNKSPANVGESANAENINEDPEELFDGDDDDTVFNASLTVSLENVVSATPQMARVPLKRTHRQRSMSPSSDQDSPSRPTRR